MPTLKPGERPSAAAADGGCGGSSVPFDAEADAEDVKEADADAVPVAVGVSKVRSADGDGIALAETDDEGVSDADMDAEDDTDTDDEVVSLKEPLAEGDPELLALELELGLSCPRAAATRADKRTMRISATIS